MSEAKYTELEVFCKATECGMDDRMHCSVLIGDIQEAAEKSSDSIGYGTPFLRDNNICWIILRMRLHFTELPSWGDRFTIRTWANSINKIYYGREFEIYSSDNRLIGQATSTWILADWASHRPVIAHKRPELPDYTIQNDTYTLGQECPKISFPARNDIAESTEKPVIIKYADYIELDRNRHVNNTKYTAWAYDALFKCGYDVSLINDIMINYNSEVKPGEKVELFVVEEKEHICVYGYKNIDTKVFAAIVSLKKP